MEKFVNPYGVYEYARKQAIEDDMLGDVTGRKKYNARHGIQEVRSSILLSSTIQ